MSALSVITHAQAEKGTLAEELTARVFKMTPQGGWAHQKLSDKHWNVSLSTGIDQRTYTTGSLLYNFFEPNHIEPFYHCPPSICADELSQSFSKHGYHSSENSAVAYKG